MKGLLLLLLLVILTGCPSKTVYVSLCPAIEGDDAEISIYVDAAGATLDTDTDQTSEVKPKAELNNPGSIKIGGE